MVVFPPKDKKATACESKLDPITWDIKKNDGQTILIRLIPYTIYRDS